MISWKLKKRSIVSRSPVEAKYRALAHATCELIWIPNLLKETGVEHPNATLLYYDSEAVQHTVGNFVFYERTKHIEVDYHFASEKPREGVTKTMPILLKNQLANLLTKTLHLR